jgi:hypothetical protein
MCLTYIYVQRCLYIHISMDTYIYIFIHTYIKISDDEEKIDNKEVILKRCAAAVQQIWPTCLAGIYIYI